MNEQEMLQVARIMHLSGLTDAVVEETIYPTTPLNEERDRTVSLTDALKADEKTKGGTVKKVDDGEYEIRLTNEIGDLALENILKKSGRIDLVRKAKGQPVYFVYTTPKAASLRRGKRRGWLAGKLA